MLIAEPSWDWNPKDSVSSKIIRHAKDWLWLEHISPDGWTNLHFGLVVLPKQAANRRSAELRPNQAKRLLIRVVSADSKCVDALEISKVVWIMVECALKDLFATILRRLKPALAYIGACKAKCLREVSLINATSFSLLQNFFGYFIKPKVIELKGQRLYNPTSVDTFI